MHLCHTNSGLFSAGSNSIQVKRGFSGSGEGANIDHLKVEGMPASVSTDSFRNPPHFMSLIPDRDQGGITEMNLRDALYETDAVLDHYFYHPNVAPFMCVRIMQRFGHSNPSPRFVANCVGAFRSGTYTSGGVSFGVDGDYGNLEATAAAILLDKEATEGAVTQDPSHGSVREPILKVRTAGAFQAWGCQFCVIFLNLLTSIDAIGHESDAEHGLSTGHAYGSRWQSNAEP